MPHCRSKSFIFLPYPFTQVVVLKGIDAFSYGKFNEAETWSLVLFAIVIAYFASFSEVRAMIRKYLKTRERMKKKVKCIACLAIVG